MHRFLAALAALILAAAAAPAVADAPRPTVTIDAGQLAGIRDGSVEVFKGIPYVAAPVGPLRWAPPQPAQPWGGVRDASKFGAICPQPSGPRGDFGQTQSEDCLFLNVWRPAGAAKAPVMVWIHGGAFRLGAGSLPYYSGADFARDGVILVSINYRLGALGFFAHPALTKAAAPDAPLGDYGLMDQIAALQWVKRNIAAFGGDPDNVTIFGESAGGVSVLDLMTIPAARGLFAKAIVESGGGWGAERDLASAEQAGVAIAQGAGLGPDATLAQLRALPADKLLKGPMTLAGFNPFTDGRLVKESATRAFAAGREAHVPLIIGSNSYEASLMQAFKIAPQAMLARLPPAMRALYPANDDAAAAAVFTDSIMGAPAHWLAGKVSAHAPAWLYHFSYVPTLQRGRTPGAGHGGEVIYVFGAWSGAISQYASPDDHLMEQAVHSCWVAFAKLGKPACDGGAWPAYSPATDELMEFGDRVGPVAHFRQAQYDALDRVMLPAVLSAR
ncbi:MAG TPA: carboxylesterase/lipase family protein [Caulobacteraceae bacterium]|jgi:para-nitrobenzyl esterase